MTDASGAPGAPDLTRGPEPGAAAAESPAGEPQADAWSAAQLAAGDERPSSPPPTITARSLRRLRIQLTVLFALMTAAALGLLVIVVLNIDEELRWTEMGETLLSRAQAARDAVSLGEDGEPDASRFLGTEDLVAGWPPAWVFEVDGTTATEVAGPPGDWSGVDLAPFVLRVAGEDVTWTEWVHTDESGMEFFARGVALTDPATTTVRAVSLAVVAREDFFADHERLANQVRWATVLLALMAAGAGYWLAGRGTRATAAALAQQERLLSDAAHELRTPVARIRAVAESGLAGDEPAGDALGRVQRLSVDAGLMVDDMLVLARMDAGREDLRRERLRLDLLAEAVAAEYPDVRVEAVETVVDGDAGLLRRAISNLVRNAVLHGGNDVRVTVYPSRVIVVDRGPGIDPAVAPHLFERFRTGPGSRGHGLGLAITRWIADAHGGSVTLADREGGGAEAVLDLDRRGTGPAGWRLPTG